MHSARPDNRPIWAQAHQAYQTTHSSQLTTKEGLKQPLYSSSDWGERAVEIHKMSHTKGDFSKVRKPDTIITRHMEIQNSKLGKWSDRGAYSKWRNKITPKPPYRTKWSRDSQSTQGRVQSNDLDQKTQEKNGWTEKEVRSCLLLFLQRVRKSLIDNTHRKQKEFKHNTKDSHQIRREECKKTKEGGRNLQKQNKNN